MKKIILGQDGDWVGGRDIARFFFRATEEIEKVAPMCGLDDAGAVCWSNGRQ